MKTTEDFTFDHYQVLLRSDGSPHELGRGAMGITYKAIDTNLQVPVALKVINEQALNSESAREQLVREARAAAKLRHPHVASVFHLGHEEGAYFYAMEYVGGETVQALVERRGPLSPRTAFRLAGQLARALGAAESHGLVHRDLKPANLMVNSADQDLCLKLIDFGLARGAQEREESATFAGTPQFASPEQWENRTPDLRSDFYALGATLWYMLMGRPPFSGTVAEVRQQHLTAPLPLAELPPLPAPATALLERLLAKDPAHRPQKAGELRQELETCLESLPDTAGTARAEEQQIARETAQNATASPLEAFATMQLIGGRYQVEAQEGETNEGWAFRARDMAGGEPVRLLLLRQNFAAHPEAFTILEQEAERLRPVSHPNLLRVHGLELLERSGILITEWTAGFTLRELLRARGGLLPAEALLLLGQMAAGVDFATGAECRRLDLSLHRILLHFPALPAAAETLPEQPLAAWPPFVVKLHPLSLARDLSAAETWAGAQTVVAAPDRTATPAGGEVAPPAYPQQLARLVYELLGGTTRPGAGYTPLAELTEEGNEVLRQALDPRQPPASGEALLRALQAVRPLETRRHEGPAEDRPARPTAPARRRSLTPWKVAALGAMALAAAYLLTRRVPSTAPAESPATPPPEALEAAAPTPGEEIAPTHPAAPEPDPRALLQAAVAEAEKTEESEPLAEAITAWLEVARAYPQAEAGRMRLELLLDKVRLRQAKLTGAELEQTTPALRAAAEAGNVSAMLLLGDSLRETDPAEAFHWYAAASSRGVPHALVQMGLMYSNGAGTPRDFHAAAEAFEQASAQGDPAAKFALAECLLSGKGVEKNPERAVELLQAAATKGNVLAMNRLASLYQQGVGGPKNFPEAFRLFSAAAELGFADARGNLGVLYLNGEGVNRSPRRAVELFQQGASAGSAFCMYLYARCLEAGIGIDRSEAEAKRWYTRAAEAGSPQAQAWCRQHGLALPEHPAAGQAPGR